MHHLVCSFHHHHVCWLLFWIVVSLTISPLSWTGAETAAYRTSQDRAWAVHGMLRRLWSKISSIGHCRPPVSSIIHDGVCCLYTTASNRIRVRVSRYATRKFFLPGRSQARTPGNHKLRRRIVSRFDGSSISTLDDFYSRSFLYFFVSELILIFLSCITFR